VTRPTAGFACAVVVALMLGCSGALAGAAPTSAAPAEPAGSPLPAAKPTEPLVVRNVAPPTPYASRPTEFVIYGSGFSQDQAKLKVTMGGVDAVSIEVQSARRLKAAFPARNKTGVAAVTVTNPNGETATLERAVYFRAGKGFSWQAMRYGFLYSWRGFREWFNLGGNLMYVFILISFFGVAWVVHCSLVLRRSQILPQKFMETLSSQLEQSDLRGATTTCERTRCAFGRVILAGLRKTSEAPDAPEKIREAITAAGSRESAHLHQKISYLANIGTISPMLGLLGTVFGMIMAFNIISLGEVRPHLLAAAIAKAMVTTAAGLVIGIPALAIYFYLRGRLLRLVTHMEVVADELTETIVEKAEEA